MKIKTFNSLPNAAVSHNPSITKKVYISKGEIPHITNISYAVLQPGQVASEHKHVDMTEALYVLSGAVEFTIELQTFMVYSGTYVIVEPNELHRLCNNTHELAEILYFGVAT